MFLITIWFHFSNKIYCIWKGLNKVKYNTYTRICVKLRWYIPSSFIHPLLPTKKKNNSSKQDLHKMSASEGNKYKFRKHFIIFSCNIWSLLILSIYADFIKIEKDIVRLKKLLTVLNILDNKSFFAKILCHYVGVNMCIFFTEFSSKFCLTWLLILQNF